MRCITQHQTCVIPSYSCFPTGTTLPFPRLFASQVSIASPPLSPYKSYLFKKLFCCLPLSTKTPPPLPKQCIAMGVEEVFIRFTSFDDLHTLWDRCHALIMRPPIVHVILESQGVQLKKKVKIFQTHHLPLYSHLVVIIGATDIARRLVIHILHI